MLIEQAIFTSAQTERAKGYQLLSRSPNLAEADARELAVWGPSEGSLSEQSKEHTSTNFFRLTSGAYAVSRTTGAGAEYSGRGGELVYTQFLVVPPQVMTRFANHPFAILRAAAAGGLLCVHEQVPESLEPLKLVGRAPVVDLGAVAQLARDPGPRTVGRLIQAALTSERLAMHSQTSCEHLVAGLFNLLPVECRTEFSFATGLKYSPSRTVRLSSLPSEPSNWRTISRAGVTLLDLAEPDEQEPTHGWAVWVEAVLASGKLSALSTELERARPGLSLDSLDELGQQQLASFRGGSRRTSAKAHLDSPVVFATKPDELAPQRADAPHGLKQSPLAVEPRRRTSALEDLATRLADQPPEVLELLEQIDDLVFAAISGDVQALAELEVLWPVAMHDLDPVLVEESREQYLRCALSICSEYLEDSVHRPERAVSAVEVLCVLFEE